MSLTEWDNRYELGIQMIDEHHKKLVELMNNTYNLILYSTKKDEMQTILTELLKFTHYHFDAEVQIMIESEYAGLKTHVSEHNIFKKQLDEMMQNYLSGAPHVDTDIVIFLWDWLQKHILKYDKKLAAYLSDRP